MWPGFDSRSRRYMWVEFVVGSRLCSEGFSPGTPVFHPPQKPTPKSSLGTRSNVTVHSKSNGPFAAIGDMVRAGGQAAHWDIQNKENSNLS